MRIIAGRLRRRVLKAPTWDGLRPTSDRLKESLFAILAPVVPGAHVLDGFAGSGALGLEAVSRGAASVTFVEQDSRAIALIAENLAHCGVSDGYVMIRGDFSAALRELPGDRRFDLILLDPPYAADDIDALVCAAGARLAAGGMLVLEHAKRRPAPECVTGLQCVRRVVAGDSALAFYRRLGTG